MKTRTNSSQRLRHEVSAHEPESVRNSMVVPRPRRSISRHSSASEVSFRRAPESFAVPRTIELYCPFSSERHQDVESVQRDSVEWAIRMGFIRSDEQRGKLERSKLAWLPGRAFPTAEREVLQLAADWTTLFCLLDDHLERREDDPLALSAYLARLDLAFTGEIGRNVDPMITAIGDLRARFARVTDGATTRRFLGAFRQLMNGYVWEGVNRWTLLTPSRSAYHSMRQITIGLRPQFVLGEIALKIQLKPGVRKHLAIARLESLTCSAVGSANDLLTCVKEFGSDHAHNIVLLLLDEGSLPFDDVVRSVAVIHDELVCAFEKVERTLPQAIASDDNVRRYVAMLRACMRGHLDWARESSRYGETTLDIVDSRRVASRRSLNSNTSL
jgi:hypothetical protein